MSYETYKVLHLIGIFALMAALGGLAFAGMSDAPLTAGRRKLVAITHGVALLIILTGGFGLLARMGISHGAGWPTWVWAKVAVWVLLGAAIAPLRRAPQTGRVLFWVLPLLGGAAAFFAVTKPWVG